MARAKLKFRLHRAVIVLICLALLVALMQGASWFSQSHQQSRNIQMEELARTLARQVSYSLAPLIKGENPDEKRVAAMLNQLTDESRILDASVYDQQGELIARPLRASTYATGWRSTAKKRAVTSTSRSFSRCRIRAARWATCGSRSTPTACRPKRARWITPPIFCA
ncbi:Lipoate-protein ligase A [Cronobacter malonaticus 681]|nr:Lipoate-protein ligase A [Cronobacter malonaticus 681]